MKYIDIVDDSSSREETYIKENVMMNGETITYGFRLMPFPVINETAETLKMYASEHKQFFKELNMSLEIAIVPVEATDKELVTFYEEREHSVFEEYREQREKIKNNLREIVKQSAYTYYVYLFVVENKISYKSISPVKRMLQKYDATYRAKQSKRHTRVSINNALTTSQSIEKIIEDTLNGYEVMHSSELMQAIEYVRSAMPPREYSSVSSIAKDKVIEYDLEYFVEDRLIQEKLYESFYFVEKVPDKSFPANYLTQIQYSNIPITMYLKCDFKLPEQAHKEMLLKKTQIKKDSKKFVRNYGRTSGEYQRSLNRAHEGEKAFELTDDSAALFQIMFKLHAKTEEELSEHKKMIFSAFRKMKYEINTMIGRQEVMREHVLPWNSLIKKHAMTELQYVADLNILGGSNLGDKTGHPFYRNQQTGEIVYLDYRKLMRGETASTSAISIFYGESGSGKSMVSYILAMVLHIMEKFPVLKINPKNDEKNIGTYQKWILPYYQNIILGSEGTHKGSLDPFYLYKDDVVSATNIAKEDIVNLAHCLKYRDINIYAVDQAVEYMIETNIKLNMTNLAKVLIKRDETKQIGEMILSVGNDRLGRLFVGDDQTSFSFDFSKYFTVLTFDDLPIIEKFDRYKLEHVITDILLTKTSAIVQQFIAYWNIPSLLIIDEYFILKRYPQGEATVDVMARIIRSKKCHMFLMTQSPSDTMDAQGIDKFANNTAMVLIGTLGSRDEILIAKKRYNLSNSLEKKLYLKLEQSKTKKKKKVHDFILYDYNKKKGNVTVVIPDNDMFLDYRNELVAEDEQVQQSYTEREEEKEDVQEIRKEIDSVRSSNMFYDD